jgi:hypothetical protein
MRNSSAFEKTALIFGLILGEIVRHLLAIHGHLDGETSYYKKVVRTVLFFGIFSKTKVLLVALLGSLTGNYKYLTLVIQPILMLVVFPLMGHLLGFGKFFGEIPTMKKKIQ